VHRVDQDQTLLDSGLSDRRLHLARDVDDLALVFSVKEEVVGVGFHLFYFTLRLEEKQEAGV